MTVNVVAAVISDGERFLVTRRPEGVHLSGLWEFPGGKTDAEETHTDALRREMLEELNADIVVGDLLYQTTHVYPERTVALFFYRCELLNAPTPMLGQDVRWVHRTELPTLGFPPADDELIKLLAKEH